MTMPGNWKSVLAISISIGLLYVILAGNYNLKKRQYGRSMVPNSTTTVIPDYTGKHSKDIPIIPVELSDWQETRPTYNLNETVTNTDWWTAASFMELEFRKRPIDYSCKNISKRSNYKVCYDWKYKPSKPCLVYSFGIAHDFTFDDEMATIDGCEVHSFDPSMGQKDYVRNSSVHFHDIGIGGEANENLDARKDIYVQKQQTWMVMTLRTIMASLGHSDRDLDVLKIDVEGHEWKVIEYLLDSGLLPKIKQLLMEYHIFKDWPHRSENPKNLYLIRKMNQAGFKKFSSWLHTLEHNPSWVHLQADTFYVNTQYDPNKKH